MNRYMRIRRYNPSSIPEGYDTLFPQGQTGNILRNENGGVLESDLLRYDRHCVDKTIHINSAQSEGTARALLVRLKDTVLTDGFPLLLTLHIDLECEPTLSFNDGAPYPICMANGERIPGGQIAGSSIFLVWNEGLACWTALSADKFSDVTRVVLPVESEYVYTALADGESVIAIPGFNKRADKLTINYHQTILRYNIDYRFSYTVDNAIELIGFTLDEGDQLFMTLVSYITTAKRGNLKYDLVSEDIAVEIIEDNTSSVKVPVECTDAHSVVINYNQTILRNNLEYKYNDSHDYIELLNFTADKGEKIVFTVTNFVETNGTIVPNNWGATGNYRYKLNVIHTEYQATEDNVTVIAVPNFNYISDDITVIRDNQMYIYNVDYAIDEIGNVVLLKGALDTDDKIYFTILQGAMADVPNFNVINANGYDGQHIVLNMSYSVLVDFYTLLVRLKHDLLDVPTVKCIDGPAEPVCDCFGNPIRGGYKKGAYLWLVYSSSEKMWYSLSHSQIDISQIIPQNLSANGVGEFVGYELDESGAYLECVIEHGLGITPEHISVSPCEPPGVDEDGNIRTIGDIWNHADERFLYVGNTGNATSKFTWSVTAEAASNDLRTYIEQEIAYLKQRPGIIETRLSAYTAMTNGVTEFGPIAEFDSSKDKLILNYNQTILREGIDYKINSNHTITLLHFSLNAGEVIQSTVLKQETD